MNEKATKIWLIISACVAIVAVISSAVLCSELITRTTVSQSREQAYLNALENSYRSCFYTLLDGINNLEVNLGKVVASSSSSVQRELLLKSAMQAESAESTAAALPVYREDIGSTVKFINQISDCCKSLIKKLSSGESLSTADKTNLKKIRMTVSELKSNLDDALSQTENLSLAKIIDGDSDFSLGNGFTVEQSDETFEYPRLIYDGPFSDSVNKEEGSRLSGNAMTVTELKEKLLSVLKAHEVRSVDYAYSLKNRGMTIHTFYVEADSDYTVSVTERGGYIVQMNGYEEREELSEQARESAFYLDLAEGFCNNAGFEVKPVWISKSIEGYVYVNLCPVTEEGIIIYPDLVKVVIDTQAERVVGIEGYGYVINHYDRRLDLGESKADAAREKISDELTVKTVNLALIPKDDDEILCYEFKCSDGENEYFVYINTDTLEEEDILRVINGTEGYTVI